MNQEPVIKVVNSILQQYSSNRTLSDIVEYGLNIDDIYDEVVYPETDAYVIKNVELDEISNPATTELNAAYSTCASALLKISFA